LIFYVKRVFNYSKFQKCAPINDTSDDTLFTFLCLKFLCFLSFLLIFVFLVFVHSLSFPLYMSLPHLFPVFRGQWTHINFIFSSMSRFSFDWRFFLLFHSFDFLFLRFECKFFFCYSVFGKEVGTSKQIWKRTIICCYRDFFCTCFFFSLSIQCIDFYSISLSFDCWLLLLTEMKWNACDILSISLFSCAQTSFFGSSLHVSRKTF